MRITIAALAALGALGGCHREPAAPPPPRPTARPAAHVDARPTPQRINDGVEAAMDAIPPDSRNQFQKLFACDIAANAKRPAAQQRQMDGAWVREMTAELARNPHAGDSC